MCVPLDGSVVEILSQVVGNLQPLFNQLFEPNAVLCELAALVTDGGATRQGLHYDTPMMAPGAALLVTCFIALQDISDEMGPTEMVRLNLLDLVRAWVCCRELTRGAL